MPFDIIAIDITDHYQPISVSFVWCPVRRIKHDSYRDSAQSSEYFYIIRFFSGVAAGFFGIPLRMRSTPQANMDGFTEQKNSTSPFFPSMW
jgi:hypothetical protein